MTPPIIALIIPAYRPTQALNQVVEGVLAGLPSLTVPVRLIVVDDGSDPASQPVFTRLSVLDSVTLLRHPANRGKGAALKTGIGHALDREGERLIGVVTADADGQHRPADILRLVAALIARPAALALGVRALDQTAPARSRLGNGMTRLVFRTFTGRRLSDTQTGLRALPRAAALRSLAIPSNGYDFELEMLVNEVRAGAEIIEVPIETVYLSGNKSSHFNPIVDSAKVYFVFIRFSALSLLAACLDFSIFLAVRQVFGSVLVCIASARLVTGVIYFHLARTRVFHSAGRPRWEAMKFASLVVVSGLLAYGMLRLEVSALGMPVLLAKPVAELVLFLVNFAVQRLVVFRPTERLSPDGPPAATDWDRYYARPAAVAGLTRRITRGSLLRLMRQVPGPEAGLSLCELGGGDSCFIEPILAALPVRRYHVIDNNRFGLDRLAGRMAARGEVVTWQTWDLRQPVPIADRFDIVFSVGLIEHFDPAGTAAVIQRHADLVRPGGTVILTFPTPTLGYRLARAALTLIGRWPFPDERPLGFAEVERTIAPLGSILSRRTNHAVILAQGVLAVRVGG